MPIEVAFILYIAFPFAFAYAAATDLLTMTISNRITLSLAAGFVPMALLAGMPLEAFGLHLAAGGAMLALTFLLFAMGWIGGGDAKLAAVAALWLGWSPQTIEFVGLASLFGGALTLAILGFRQVPLPAFAFRSPWILRLHDADTGIPYGIALAAGALAVYPRSIWMTALLA